MFTAFLGTCRCFRCGPILKRTFKPIYSKQTTAMQCTATASAKPFLFINSMGCLLLDADSGATMRLFSFPTPDLLLAGVAKGKLDRPP